MKPRSVDLKNHWARLDKEGMWQNREPEAAEKWRREKLIMGEYGDEKTLRPRVSLMEGSYGPIKLMFSINADSKILFVKLDGHRVRYKV